ncbi:hypothetical protein [Sunxiuqinia indica]|uniref:hypothetical protein n=1 Tax=Sunxiuqinia indica TaxID=2692584 RepID=UPI00135CA549|nr:hypothetical protein [Sunxiuqinia indica]
MIKSSRYILWIFLLLAGVGKAQAQFSETREIQKRFAVTPTTSIEITNKYGKIELYTWDKDSVVVDVTMKVEEKKMSRLDKKLDNIDFDFTSSTHYLIIRTIADKNQSQLESEFLKFKETLLQTDGTIEIDYKIWLPASNPLKIENKFGDIYIDDYNGPIEVDLSNGKLKAHDLTQKANIQLNFADASINSMPNGRITTNYSDFYLKSTDNLRISSKSSEIEIIEAKSLIIDSRRDKFRLRRADQIEAEGSFTSFRLNQLTDRGTFRFSYGDLEMEKIASNFADLYIESKNTDVSLYFNPESVFNFEITTTKADLLLGRELEVEDQELLDDKNDISRRRGYFGKKTAEDQKLNINAVSGEVSIFSN